MRRTVFNEDHEAFRETLRAFIEAEVVPVYDEWFAAGQAPREFYHQLGELGIFGINVPEEFGGAGMDSHKFEAVLYEETARAGVQFGGSGVHVLLALPYIKMLATDETQYGGRGGSALAGGALRLPGHTAALLRKADA